VLLWIAIVLAALAVAIPLGAWAASALWVRIISKRWDAMCADEEPPPLD
jgi:hypothetical protein